MDYESDYRVSNSSKVIWKFYKIERVFAIGECIEDGVELFSRFLRESEVESILTPFED